MNKVTNSLTNKEIKEKLNKLLNDRLTEELNDYSLVCETASYGNCQATVECYYTSDDIDEARVRAKESLEGELENCERFINDHFGFVEDFNKEDVVNILNDLV